MEKRWITASELGQYLGVSLKTARKLGREWQAEHKLGYKTVRYDLLIVDREMNRKEEAEDGDPGRAIR